MCRIHSNFHDLRICSTIHLTSYFYRSHLFYVFIMFSHAATSQQAGPAQKKIVLNSIPIPIRLIEKNSNLLKIMLITSIFWLWYYYWLTSTNCDQISLFNSSNIAHIAKIQFHYKRFSWYKNRDVYTILYVSYTFLVKIIHYE